MRVVAAVDVTVAVRLALVVPVAVVPVVLQVPPVVPERSTLDRAVVVAGMAALVEPVVRVWLSYASLLRRLLALLVYLALRCGIRLTVRVTRTRFGTMQVALVLI
jgi:hypothetical protein